MSNSMLLDLEKLLSEGKRYHIERKFKKAKTCYENCLKIGLKIYDNTKNENEKTEIGKIIKKIYDKMEKCKVTFDDVIGLEDFKKLFNENILRVVRNPNLAKEYEITANCCILLQGPPGTGKSFAIKAAVNEFPEAKLIETRVSNLVDSYIGNTAKNIDKLFQEAIEYTREHDNCYVIIFIDEIDGIGRSRKLDDKAAKEAMSSLLVNLTKVDEDNLNIIFVAATNTPDQIDAALLSRFGDNVIEVPLPNKESRIQILKNLIHKVDPSLDWDKVAKATEGLSGRDLKFIAKSANNEAFIKADKMIEAGELDKDIKDNYPSVDNKILLDAVNTAVNRINSRKNNYL